MRTRLSLIYSIVEANKRHRYVVVSSCPNAGRLISLTWRPRLGSLIMSSLLGNYGIRDYDIYRDNAATPRDNADVSLFYEISYLWSGALTRILHSRARVRDHELR